MNKEVLELTKKFAFQYDNGKWQFNSDIEVEAFYRVLHNKVIEQAARECIHWRNTEVAAAAIRSLEIR